MQSRRTVRRDRWSFFTLGKKSRQSRRSRRIVAFEQLDDRRMLSTVNGAAAGDLWASPAQAMPPNLNVATEPATAGPTAPLVAAAPPAPVPAPAPNTIGGTVFRDLNGDGVRQSWEPGVPGLGVYLDLNRNGQFDAEYATTVDCLNGVLSANGFSGTVTHICNVAGNEAMGILRDIDMEVTGYTNSEPNLTLRTTRPGAALVTLASGDGNRLFGATFSANFDDEATTSVTSASSLSGRLQPRGFLSNFDGGTLGGTWELRLSSAFALQEVNDWRLQARISEPFIMTDSEGNYRFDSVLAGTHRVVVETPTSWLATGPTSGIRDVALASGGYVENATFAVRPTDVPLLAPDSQEPNNETPQGAFSWAPFCPQEGCQGSRIIQRRSIHSAQDVDWYRFETLLPGESPHHVRVYNFDPRIGDLRLELFDESVLTNPVTAPIASTRSTGGVSLIELSLKGFVPGVYFARVSGEDGAISTSYNLAVVHPGADWLDNLTDAPPNNSRAAATDLGRLEGSASHDSLSIDSESDEDWFRFDSAAFSNDAHYVQIDFDHALGDLDLEFYAGNDPEPLIISNGVTGRERIGLAGLPVDVYYIRVLGFDGATNPYYRLELNVPYGPAGDPYEGASGNNSRPNAYDLGRFQGEKSLAHASLHSTSDTDWYEFEMLVAGTVGDAVRVEFDHRLGDIDLILRDANGTEIDRSDGVGDREEVSLSGRAAGVYFAEVYPYAELANPAYTLTVNAPRPFAPDWAEPNESSAQVRDLGRVSARRQWDALSLHWSGDRDEFLFTLPQRGVPGNFVRIDFENSVGNVDMALYRVDGGSVGHGRSQRNYEEISLEGLPAGQYRLVVLSGTAGATNPHYSITIDAPPALAADAFETNDSFDDATELGVIQGERIWEQLSLHTIEDVDFFRFEITEPAVAGHFARIDYDYDLGDLALWLYNASGTQVLRESDGQTDREEISLAGLTPGVYFLVVDGLYVGGTNPQYALTIRAPQPLGEDWADGTDGNDSLFDPYDLGVLRGERVWSNLSIHEFDDFDYFRFVLPEAGMAGNFIRVEFNHSLGDVDAYLYDAQGNLIDLSIGVTDREEISLDGLLADVPYFLEVSTWGGDVSPNYTLTIGAPAGRDGDLFEYNDELAYATNLGPLQGFDVWGDDVRTGLSIHSSDDVDYYRFAMTEAATAGHFARIDFNHADGDLNLELLADDGSLVRASTGTDDFEHVGFENLTAGTYLLRVYGSRGAANPEYRLSINASGTDWSETGDSAAANAFDLGELAAHWSRGGLSIHAGDIDWFRFTLAADQVEGNYLRLNFDQSHGDLEVDLFDNPSGIPLRLARTSDDGELISLAGLKRLNANSQTITYYARVRGTAGATSPAYRLSYYANRALAADVFEGNDPTAFSLGTTAAVRRMGSEYLNPDYPRLGLSIHAPDDVDWFEFTTLADATPAHFVSIDLNQFAGDLDLELWRDDVLLRHSRTSANTESIGLHGLPAGTYRVKVSGFNGATNPEYFLTINPPAAIFLDWAEVNNDRNAPKDFRIVQGTRRFDNLSINEANDVDWFRFQLAAGAEPIAGNLVAVDYDPAYGYLDLELFDASGQNRIAEAGGFTGRAEIPLRGYAAAGQTYLVKVSARGLEATLPQYRLTIVAPELQGDRTEGTSESERLAPIGPGDSRQSAHDLGQLQGFSALDDLSIHVAGDVDWFRFTLPSSAVAGYHVALSSEFQNGDIDIELYDAAGNRIRTAVGGASSASIERLDLSGLAAGPVGTPYEYYMKVFGYEANSTNPSYRLFWNAPALAIVGDRWESNNTRQTATNLQVVESRRTAAGLSIHDAADQDWFAFQLPRTAAAGHYVAIDFDHAQGNLDIDLRDQNGNLIAGRASATATGHEEISLAGLAATPGGSSANYYYLRVYGSGGAVNPNYALTFNAPAAAQADRYDVNGLNNGTLATATQLREVSGALVVGDLSRHTGSDDDWFRFETLAYGVAGESVRIEFNRAEGALALELREAGGALVASAGGGYADYEEISLAGRPAGTYYARVTGAANPRYALFIDAPVLPAPDAAEGKRGNDTPETSYDLRVVGPTEARGCGYQYQYNSWTGGQQPVLVCDPPIADRTFQQGARFYANNPQYGGLPGSAQATGIVNNGLNLVGALGPFTGVDQGTPQVIQDITCQLNPYADSCMGLPNPRLGSQPQQTISYLPLQGGSQPTQQASQAAAVASAVASTRTTNLQRRKALQFLAAYLATKGFRSENAAALPSSTLGNLSIDSASDVDWYRITLDRDGIEGQAARVLFDHNQGNLDLELFAVAPDGHSAGERIDASTSLTGVEEISLTRLRAGNYYLKVHGVDGATNPNYRLQFSVAPPADTPRPDWAEPNDASVSARDLRRLEGPQVFDGLSIHAPGDEDWFHFELATPAADESLVGIVFQHAQGDLDLELYRGTLVGGRYQVVNPAADLLGRSDGTANREQIVLADASGNRLAAGHYFVRVHGFDGATNPHYSLVLNLPESTVAPDYLESNNTLAQATNLNNLTASGVLPGLSIETGDVDYFRFTTTVTARESHTVSIAPDARSGSLQLELRDASDQPIAGRTAVNGRIDLNGLAAGTYYVRVSGTGGAVGRYDLHFDAPTSSSGSLADWTVMVYMSAGELARYAAEDINEMEAAAARLPGSVNFVVLYDQPNDPALPRYSTGGGLQPAWGGTGFGVIRPDTNRDAIATAFNTSWRGGEQNLSTAATLQNFLVDAAAAAPARNYALVLWNHGGGIRGTNYDRFDFNGQSPPPGADTVLSIGEIATALSATRVQIPVKVLAFDACYMAMTEVAAMLAPYTEVVVASQEVEGFGGFDYTTAFDALTTLPGSATSLSIGSSMAASYQRRYQNDAQGADTLSAVRSESYSLLGNALSLFAAATSPAGVPDGPQWSALHAVLRDARNAAPSFNRQPDFRDLGRFIHEVAVRTEGTPAFDLVRIGAMEVARAVESIVFAKTADRGGTTGLSIYLPAPGGVIDPIYAANGEFAPFFNTGWRDFIARFAAGPATGEPATGDWSESGETASRAYDLRTLIAGPHAFTDLSLHRADDRDWFRFRTLAVSNDESGVVVQFPTGQGTIRAAIYPAADTAAPLAAASSASGHLRLSLAGQPAGEYYVSVEAEQWREPLDYGLIVAAPADSNSASIDWAGGNRSATKSRPLGTIAASAVWSGLRVESNQSDWFVFDTPRTNADGPAAHGAVLVQVVGDAPVTVKLWNAADDAAIALPLAFAVGTGALRLEYPLDGGRSYRLAVFGDGGEAVQSYSLHFDPTGGRAASPRVVGVAVRGSSWATEEMFASVREFATYSISPGASQLDSLPWTNLDRVELRFDRDVIVSQNDLTIRGLNRPQYPATAFQYDPRSWTATWTLADPIGADRLQLELSPVVAALGTGATLDGEWVSGASAFPSGNGTEGGAFRFAFNILPGDVDRNDTVDRADLAAGLARQFRRASDTDYDLLADVNGDGRVNVVDAVLIRNAQGSSLPSAQLQSTALVSAGAIWKYRDDGADLGTAWRMPQYDDALWSEGVAELGYGDGDEATIVGFGGDSNARFITTYFRKTFNVANPASIYGLQLRLLRDDGAAVYFNGVEIARDNLPLGAGYQTPALSALAGRDESRWLSFGVDPNLLRQGQNVLAVEVHQSSGTSSDLSFDLELWANGEVIHLVSEQSVWKYRSDGQNLGVVWRTAAFDDSTWSQGQAELGYGDGDEATVIPCGPSAPVCTSNNHITAYFRRDFYIDDPSDLSHVRLYLLRDDGAAVYINGQEVSRDNLLPNAAFNTPALGPIPVEGVFAIYTVPTQVLVAGRNVVAAEIHQSGPTSSDLSFDLRLTAVRAGEAFAQSPAPPHAASAVVVAAAYRQQPAAAPEAMRSTPTTRHIASAVDRVITARHESPKQPPARLTATRAARGPRPATTDAVFVDPVEPSPTKSGKLTAILVAEITLSVQCKWLQT